MDDFAKLAVTEKDPVRRAHFERMAAGPDGIAHLVGFSREKRKRDEKRAMIEEMVRIGEANKNAPG